METFGEMLKKLRKEKKMTLRELAKEVDSNYAYLSQLEAGLTKPSEELARRIAEFFGKDVEELIFIARGIPEQIEDIKRKFPNMAPPYFRKAGE